MPKIRDSDSENDKDNKNVKINNNNNKKINNNNNKKENVKIIIITIMKSIITMIGILFA